MKILSFCFFLFAFYFSHQAQEYKKISDPSSCKMGIQKKQNATSSLSADFKEIAYSSMFKNANIGSGSLLYKKEQKIRWEHDSPKKSILLIDGNKIKYSENGKEIKDASTKMVVKKIQSLMIKMLNGDFFDGKEFKITYYENSQNYKLNLTPTSGRMSKYIESIVLIFSKKDSLLQEMSLVENETDKVVYQFSTIRSNPTINDSKFKQF